MHKRDDFGLVQVSNQLKMRSKSILKNTCGLGGFGRHSGSIAYTVLIDSQLFVVGRGSRERNGYRGLRAPLR